MKIIFLDIDGVISTANTGYSLDGEKIKLLHEIIDRTGAKIVLSSSWRKHNLEATKEKFKNTSFVDYIIGVTPRFNVQDNNGDYFSVPRGMEIDYWLDHCEEEIESYVILDDERTFLLDQKEHFVQTNMYFGLLEDDVELAVKILNNKMEIKDFMDDEKFEYLQRTKWGYWYHLISRYGKETVDEMFKNGFISKDKDKWRVTNFWSR